MTILRHCVKILPRRLILIFTPDAAKPAGLKIAMYSLGLFRKMPSHGFILIITPVPKQSIKKVLYEPLKMTILGLCVKIPPRRSKLNYCHSRSCKTSQFETCHVQCGSFWNNAIAWILPNFHSRFSRIE